MEVAGAAAGEFRKKRERRKLSREEPEKKRAVAVGESKRKRKRFESLRVLFPPLVEHHPPLRFDETREDACVSL